MEVGQSQEKESEVRKQWSLWHLYDPENDFRLVRNTIQPQNCSVNKPINDHYNKLSTKLKDQSILLKTNKSIFYVLYSKICSCLLTVAVDALDLRCLRSWATFLLIVRNTLLQANQTPVMAAGVITWHRLQQVWAGSWPVRWFVGNLSCPDFITYEVLWQILIMNPHQTFSLKDFNWILDFVKIRCNEFVILLSLKLD